MAYEITYEHLNICYFDGIIRHIKNVFLKGAMLWQSIRYMKETALAAVIITMMMHTLKRKATAAAVKAKNR